MMPQAVPISRCVNAQLQAGRRVQRDAAHRTTALNDGSYGVRGAAVVRYVRVAFGLGLPRARDGPRCPPRRRAPGRWNGEF